MFNGNWPTQPPTPGRYAEVHVSLSPRGAWPRHPSFVAPTSHKKQSRSFKPRVRILLAQTLVSREDPHRERCSCSHWRERGGQPRVLSASLLFPRFANCCRLCCKSQLPSPYHSSLTRFSFRRGSSGRKRCSVSCVLTDFGCVLPLLVWCTQELLILLLLFSCLLLMFSDSGIVRGFFFVSLCEIIITSCWKHWAHLDNWWCASLSITGLQVHEVIEVVEFFYFTHRILAQKSNVFFRFLCF